MRALDVRSDTLVHEPAIDSRYRPQVLKVFKLTLLPIRQQWARRIWFAAPSIEVAAREPRVPLANMTVAARPSLLFPSVRE
jgi:hypothetical protein